MEDEEHNYEDETQFNSEDDDDDDLTIQRTNGSTWVKRGLFRSRDVWNLRNGDRIVVECNEHNQPDDRGGRILGGWLGKVARRPNLCPLNYHTWIKMPLTFKKGVTDLAKDKFVLPFGIEKWILKSTSKKWRSYKSDLKSKYMIDGMTEQEIARQPPEEIPLQQWIDLVHYWFSNKGKIGSEKGKRARAQQVAPHTSGSESFARKKRKFKKKHKRDPAPLEWYSIIHKHKDGAFVNQASEQLVVNATAMIVERTANSELLNLTEVEKEVYEELIGPDQYGRVIGYGLGVSARMVNGTSAGGRVTTDGANIEQLIQARVEEMMNYERGKMELQFQNKFKEEMSNMEIHMEAMQLNHEAQMSAMQGQVNNIISLLAGFGERTSSGGP